MFDHTIRIGDEQAMKAINARPAGEGRAQRLHRDVGAAAPARDRRRRRGGAAVQEALGHHPGVAADPRHGDDRPARHLRRPHHPADRLHPGAAPLQGPHRRGLPHRLQSGARVVLFPADEAPRGDGVQGVRHRSRTCRRNSPRTRRSTIPIRRRTRRRARASRRGPSRSGIEATATPRSARAPTRSASVAPARSARSSRCRAPGRGLSRYDFSASIR